jgi:hypothetical protein
MFQKVQILIQRLLGRLENIDGSLWSFVVQDILRSLES